MLPLAGKDVRHYDAWMLIVFNVATADVGRGRKCNFIFQPHNASATTGWRSVTASRMARNLIILNLLEIWNFFWSLVQSLDWWGLILTPTTTVIFEL